MTALMVCIRFSASWNTMDCGPVNTSSVTSKLIPYFVALVLALLAVTYIPALSLGLPSLMGLI